jgi:cardiolipin synthase
MDYRSFYLHYENGVWVYDEEFLQKVKNDFEKTFRQCKEITLREWEERPFFRKIIQHILHVFDTLA